jgi:hypothetical protein
VPTTYHDLKLRFGYHRPDADQQRTIGAIRRQILNTAVFVVNVVPEGREQASALSALEQVMFQAVAGVARLGPLAETDLPRQVPAEVTDAVGKLAACDGKRYDSTIITWDVAQELTAYIRSLEERAKT